MKVSFAKGIAANISQIAQATVKLELTQDPFEVCELKSKIKKAEDNIAAFLQQPGTFWNHQ